MLTPYYQPLILGSSHVVEWDSTSQNICKLTIKTWYGNKNINHSTQSLVISNLYTISKGHLFMLIRDI